MSNPSRKSLRDRNSEAIAGPTGAGAVGPSAPDKAPPAEETKGAVTTSPVSSTKGRASSTSETAADDDTARIGIYFHPEQFDTAKAAYLADWQAGGQADTFARWIAGALDEHAQRTPQQRGQLARPQERAATRGSSRSFKLPASTVASMRQSITADQGAGRWPSDSAWCGDAIAAAANQARQRVGGTLPQPPTRLPNRLAR